MHSPMQLCSAAHIHVCVQQLSELVEPGKSALTESRVLVSPGADVFQ